MRGVPHAHNVQLLVKITVQPDDGQYTGPKHVVVCTNLCENIYSCVLTIYRVYQNNWNGLEVDYIHKCGVETYKY